MNESYPQRILQSEVACGVLLEVVVGVLEIGLAEHLEYRTRHSGTHADFTNVPTSPLADSAFATQR